MEQIYSVRGALDRGFVGQITYMISLEKTYKALDICFSFDKRKYTPEDVTPALVSEMRQVFLEKYGAARSEEEMRQCILRDMKAELHILATLNDEFLGCVHRQLDTRHLLFDGENATEGCIPRDSFAGVLKVTVLVFNVIKDDTRYALTVNGRE